MKNILITNAQFEKIGDRMFKFFSKNKKDSSNDVDATEHHIDDSSASPIVTKMDFRVKNSSFLGVVLFRENGFDFEKFKSDLAKLWSVDLDEDTMVGVRVDGTHVYRVGGITVTIRLANTTVTKTEVEFAAARNYMWNEAVQEVREHKSHLHVSVVGEGEPNIKGTLFTKILDSCCQQDGVVGVYANGVVHSPDVYKELADIMIPEGDSPLPILNLVWVGFNKTVDGYTIYTSGMRSFGKEEIEIINSDISLNKLHTAMLSLVTNVLENDINLSEGETIDFIDGEPWKIRRSAAVSTDGLSLKLELN